MSCFQQYSPLSNKNCHSDHLNIFRLISRYIFILRLATLTPSTTGNRTKNESMGKGCGSNTHLRKNDACIFPKLKKADFSICTLKMFLKSRNFKQKKFWQCIFNTKLSDIHPGRQSRIASINIDTKYRVHKYRQLHTTQQ